MSLREKMDSKEFVVLAEFDPPKGADFSPLLEKGKLVRGRVDAIVVPEMASAVMKASSLGGCAFFEMHGFETIMQACCRDRNRLALQADLLAASALGVRNVMVVQGEDIRFGDHPHARVVDDLEVPELLDAIQTLQAGKDMAGIELQGSPEFYVGTTVDAGASGGLLELELENLQVKVDKGAKFVVTTPIFDIRRFQAFLKRIEAIDVAIVPTVLLLKSAGMARYIDRNIRSISIPSELIRGIQKAPDKQRECIRIAADLVSRIKDMGMAGVLISTIGWEDRLPLVLDEAKL